ncbi:hypothetical protein [Streptomyces decoyicus]|uniref:hypothetical protein n=1 Tax=Streptomyces decoyicus TaxID=249567 RepID=UPI0033BF6B74
MGTGTGYHAAWLAHRLGGDRTTTIETDKALHDIARDNLARAGLHPHMECGDGLAGTPPLLRPHPGLVPRRGGGAGDDHPRPPGTGGEPGRPLRRRPAGTGRLAPALPRRRRQRRGHVLALRRRPQLLGHRRVRPRPGHLRDRTARPAPPVGRRGVRLPRLDRRGRPHPRPLPHHGHPRGADRVTVTGPSRAPYRDGPNGAPSPVS